MQLFGTVTTIPTYPLTVSPATEGTITSSPSGINCGTTCEKTFNEDTSITLTATPRSGYRFTGWTGACTNTTGDCVLTMDAAKNVTATFGGIEVAHYSFDNTHDDTS